MELESKELERFELLVPIARGATGQIFEARDRSDPSGSVVAIKVFDENLAEGPRFATILNAEAPAAVAFRHDNAARTVFAGRSGRHTVIAMERLAGQSLASMLGNPPPWEIVCWIGLQVVQVLRAAHQTPWAEGEPKGMYHCAITPHSIFLLPNGHVRLLGVGLGRSRMCLAPSREKLPYRAPELFERRKPDAETDVYSLGVTLYDALAGSPAFGRETVAEIKESILGETPPSLRAKRPELDPAIDDLLAEMMSKFPRTRPSLSKVEEVFRTLQGRSGFSSSGLERVLAGPSAKQTPPSKNGRSKNGAKPDRESTGDFYPGYEIDDLVEKLLASKKATPFESEPDIQFSSADLDPSLSKDLVPAVRTVEPSDERPAPQLGALDDGGSDNPFDVDAIVNAIVKRRKPDLAPPLERTPPRVPPPRVATPPPRALEVDDQKFYQDALSTLDDANGSFDLDGIVNAIVSSAAPKAKESELPKPRRDVTPPDVTDTGDVLVSKESLKPGQVIGDRYRVIDELGEGGMSVVYRVEHTLLLKQMALKLLRYELSSMPSVVERFQLEARSVCQLDDPNIVRVTDFGRQPNGSLYLVMEYLEGESLASKLRREKKLPPAQAMDIAVQILSGLSHAHRFGVVHRDLKPENIMLVARHDRTSVKILDFGIAKMAARDEAESAKPITQKGTVFGTPRYMSPEQAAAETVDLRADIYAVGVILYECLKGEPPFDGSSAVKILAKVLTEDVPRLGLTEPNRKAGLEIEAAVMRALEKEKEDRFPTADAFRAALVKAMR